MRAIRSKGLTFSETAQRARRHLPAHTKLSHTSVWSYATGRATPKRLPYIEAIEKALGVEPHGLSGPRRENEDGSTESQVPGTTRGGKEHVLAITDCGNGVAHLNVQTVVSWEVALAVMNLLCKRARNTATMAPGA